MKLNLGCGSDIKEGYINVDFRKLPGVDVTHDLLQLPWPWGDESCDEVLMLDFFEHIPYAKNGAVLDELWRVIKPDGNLVVQVPDFDHSVAVVQKKFPFVCNKCEKEIDCFSYAKGRSHLECCKFCGHLWTDMAQVAMQRLYGGQDYPGNWHFFSFNFNTLRMLLNRHGFRSVQPLEEEHQYRQWSLKVVATREKDVW